MAAVAILAVLLGLATSAWREYDRMFPSNPAQWARYKAALHEQGPFASPKLVTRYRELAAEFERTGEVWAEGTYLGPYTDRLAAGESVIVRQATRAEAIDLQGRRLTGGHAGPVAKGTAGIVVKDWAGDDDDCYEFRRILLRSVDGPHQGENVSVERVYLRRRQKSENR